MNQSTPAIPVAVIADNCTVDREIDCSPSNAMQFVPLAREIENLRGEIDQLTHQNEELKQAIDSIYASPAAKRELLARMEQKYKISRRRACSLLSLARSTCWYRSSTGQSFLKSDETDITALSNYALVQRLKKLARQAENGLIPLNETRQSQLEYGLNKIGLAGAAQLSRTNLKLAMEIFSAWCQQTRPKNTQANN